MRKAREWRAAGRNGLNIPIPERDVIYRESVHPGTFQARDNISNFIAWCRTLQIHECLLFETDDLVLRKNERSVILCLLEVARRGSKFGKFIACMRADIRYFSLSPGSGMPAPLLVQMEQEIDRELEDDNGSDNQNIEPPPQIITNDLRTLHERVCRSVQPPWLSRLHLMLSIMPALFGYSPSAFHCHNAALCGGKKELYLLLFTIKET